MNTDYSFPLLDQMLHGQLNPMLEENLDGYDYSIKLESQIISRIEFEGKYCINYPPFFNLKTRYYQRILQSETNIYIEEMIDMINNETNEDVRHYLRDQILDKHLTSCLKRVGEKINKLGLAIKQLLQKDEKCDKEILANTYIFHLLKVCIARAYLEIQHQLHDVIAVPMTEKMLYASFSGDSLPVYCFLRNRNSSPDNVAIDNKSVPTRVEHEKKYYSKQEVCTLLKVSDTTLERYAKKPDFPKVQKKNNKNFYVINEIDKWRYNNP